ncbi:MAG TPA: long-chain fatty acid--CoA ligase [Amycolatopsis sp.]|nr:long-chain fatty acid--CoA ligase [Amycolatopsis sp.]
MRNQGIGSWPARRVRRNPDRIAIVHNGQSWSDRELLERVLRLASGLRRLGVRRGDRVAYLGPNHPAYLETLFAAGVLGAVFVPLNMRLAEPELVHILTDSGTSLLVHAPEQADVVEAIKVPRLDRAGYDELIVSSPAEPMDEPVGHDDVCLIMYTSGTTGRAKGVVLTHGNIIWNSLNVLVDVDLAGDEVTLVVAPLFHTAALNMTCLPTLLKGGTVVLMSTFDPAAVLEMIETRRVTYLFGVPAMYDAMAASPRWADTDLSSLRHVICGGAPVPAATIRTYLSRGLHFSEGYGLTEASPGVLFLAKDMSTAKAGTAGVPHFFTDARVVGPDFADVAPGEKGEIVVSGPNVMRGYWNGPDSVAGDWLHTGDVGSPDDDGYVSIVDRMKDMIISGGENIYPAEVEDVLDDHPAVAEAALIGVPDERWGEVGRAVVVLRPGVEASEEDILAYLRERLAKYKVPTSVVFADGLPRTATGKLLKSAIRSAYS